jgi:hypothetical protein
MEAAFCSNPHELLACLGPAIGPCCYTVGHDVASAMGYALPDWRQVMHPEGGLWRLDLPAANAQLLTAAGVLRIEQANLCTACHRDEFFSHRGDGGQTGRFAVVAQLKASSPSMPSAALTSAPCEPRQIGPNESEGSRMSGLPGHAPDRERQPTQPARHTLEEQVGPDTLQPPGLPGFSEASGLGEAAAL